jgi:hypothetical protein
VLGLAVFASALPSHAGDGRLALLGQPAPAAAAERTIVITPDTRYVNVEGGETVRFVVGERVFAWSFDGALTVDAVDLKRIVPAGVVTNKVIAYVAPDPRYLD